MIKDILRPFYRFAIKAYKGTYRFFYHLGFNKEKIKQIPIVINNRNRYTYLVKVISRLEKAGYENIYIIDNASDYPPLLEFYKTCKYKVFRLKENVGYMALWKTDIYDQFKWGYYVYTDPDVEPIAECPVDFLEHLYGVLKEFPNVEKVGLGLKLDDLPDHYGKKEAVQKWEDQFWKREVKKDIFDADVDTTFALYRPLAKGNAEECKAYRTGGIYQARHLPWYENSLHPEEENVYYEQHIKQGASHWIGR